MSESTAARPERVRNRRRVARPRLEGFEDAKTVVIETIVEELRRARPNSTKVADAAKKVLKRVDWLKLARKTGGFAFTAASGIPTFDQIKGLRDFITGALAKPGNVFRTLSAKYRRHRR